jgi:hypothetical protein
MIYDLALYTSEASHKDLVDTIFKIKISRKLRITPKYTDSSGHSTSHYGSVIGP